ncbi:hypothetical protein ACFGVS_25680 [Mucilaginibacter sp. AW1-7]|uniref:hypothetical protein n=1 Tax=Mucilaginibacter sp. AW1-7 TaxID=3349874 RepID=UPI003F7329A4
MLRNEASINELFAIGTKVSSAPYPNNAVACGPRFTYIRHKGLGAWPVSVSIVNGATGIEG